MAQSVHRYKLINGVKNKVRYVVVKLQTVGLSTVPPSFTATTTVRQLVANVKRGYDLHKRKKAPPEGGANLVLGVRTG